MASNVSLYFIVEGVESLITGEYGWEATSFRTADLSHDSTRPNGLFDIFKLIVWLAYYLPYRLEVNQLFRVLQLTVSYYLYSSFSRLL